jgi:hypothetical protein
VQEFCAYYSLPVQENGVIIHSTFVGMHEWNNNELQSHIQ